MVYSIKKKAILLAALLFAAIYVSAQTKLDSIQHLNEVVISSDERSKEIRSTSPLQILSQESLDKINALQLSDAVKHFSGVTVKDYGGVGGLKTLSVRSLGANHTAISYEGITINDVQTGQIDLGRFSLENVERLTFSIGQEDNIFCSARHFASGSVLSIKTIQPKFEQGKKTKGNLSFKTGSWKLANPSLFLQQQISNKTALTFSGEYLTTDGKYPYTLHYGFVKRDSTSNEVRQNTDVKNIRLESSILTQFSEREKAQFKVYYYQLERGLPGATIFYNTKNFSSQRLWDNTFFAQASYENKAFERWDFQTKGKYNRGYVRYLDPTFLNQDGKEDNTYIQQEYYLSGVAQYRASKNASFSLSNDIFYTGLDANLYQFAYPNRWTNLSVLAGKYVSEHLLATASLLATVVNEGVRSGQAGKNYRKLSPYISLSFKPFRKSDFRIRAFYKNIFRMPTFNDLYYSRIGNPNLLPEKANQFNIGLSYQKNVSSLIPHFSVTADIYHNVVKDKIVAYPTKNIFVWTMLNFGKVEMNGLDLTAAITLSLADNYSLYLNSNYSYQRALNKTDKNTREYKHQIPYTPRVSGSSRLALETPIATLSYSMLWSGKRYSLQQNYAENRLPSYEEHNFMLSTDYKWNSNILKLKIELLNITNQNYAIVRYFPMPGRSWRATLGYSF